MILSEMEIRILGALIEKELTTPDYYPLSLNGLKNACNQKSNRNPVMDIDEQSVTHVLNELNVKKLVIFSSGASQRVTKYKHNCREIFSLDRREIAIFAVLLLRGAQTLGEVRNRTQRMYQFESLDEVHEYMQLLQNRETPLVRLLPRQPGQKEQRYIQLLSGDEVIEPEEIEPETSEIDILKEQIIKLQDELHKLKEDFYKLRDELM